MDPRKAAEQGSGTGTEEPPPMEGNGDRHPSEGPLAEADLRHALTMHDEVIRSSVRARLFDIADAVHIGRYRIVDFIGGGGMGVVYAAYDEQLDREVALKLLQSGSSSSSERGHARLEREAQAMAKLSHPNVVHIYEVGEHEGRVFLAMEFVRGTTLRQWLEDRRRSWRETLNIFMQAGQGLAAAHAAGLIHRDFKPDNVLVGNDGRVRVTDFGLARTAMGSDGEASGSYDGDRTAPSNGSSNGSSNGPKTDKGSGRGSGHGSGSGSGSGRSTLDMRLTKTGAALGTPAFMSPEQHLRQPIDARSDQFSFCVALYEALYGKHPFFGQTRAAIAVSVMEGNLRPPPKRTRIPKRIYRALRRGLSQDPQARFATMDDLLIALAGRPASKHFALGGAAAAITAAVTLTQLLAKDDDPCASADTAIEDVWNEPRRSEIKAAFLSSELPFAKDSWPAVERALDDYAEKWTASRRNNCQTYDDGSQSAALFDLRVACLESHEDALDTVVKRLSSPETSNIRSSLQLIATLPDIEFCNDRELVRTNLPSDRETRQQVSALRRSLTEARTQAAVGSHEEALKVIDQVVKKAEQLGHQPTVADALYELGNIQEQAGQRPDAIDSLRKALYLAEESRNAQALIDSLTLLGHLAATELKNQQLAENWIMRATAVIKRMGASTRHVIVNHRNRAELHELAGQYEDAGRAFERALQESKRYFGPEHLETARSNARLGLWAVDRGEYERARLHLQQALHTTGSLLGKKHPETAIAQFNLAILERRTGNLRRAQELCLRGLESADRDFSGRIHAMLAELAKEAGDYDALRMHAEHAAKLLPAGSSQQNSALSNLAVAHHMQQQYGKALEYYDQALAQIESGPEDIITASFVRGNRAETLFELERFAEAAAEYKQVLIILNSKLPANHEAIALMRKGYAKVLLTTGQRRNAMRLLEQALETLTKHNSLPQELADVRWTLARSLKAHDRTRARRLAQDALAYYRQAPLGEETSRSISAWLEHFAD